MHGLVSTVIPVLSAAVGRNQKIIQRISCTSSGRALKWHNLKRFIFYLSEEHTRGVFSGKVRLTDEAPLSVVQNLEGGGSIAVTRQAYDLIGGLDESFVGWGGADNEFWERAQTRRVWPYAYLPIVHLWHPAQPRKADPANPNSRLYEARSKIAPEHRIAELNQRDFGETDRLSVDWTGP